jgi:hypothetical protein
MRYKAGQAFVTMATKERGTIERMEAESVQRRGISDVVHERGCHQQFAILDRQDCGHSTRLVGYCLDMQPPVAQRSDQSFCLRLCPRFQRHGATIPCALDRAQAVLLAA